MLLKARGIDDITQVMIAKEKRSVKSTASELADAMNALSGRPGWRGGQLDNVTNPKGLFGNLSGRGPFITSMKNFGSETHMVVVDGLDGVGNVIVRDPWGEGTRYTMEWADFVTHWIGDTVYWNGL